MKIKYASLDKAPTCLHALGQPLVDAIWAEARALYLAHENDRCWQPCNSGNNCGRQTSHPDGICDYCRPHTA